MSTNAIKLESIQQKFSSVVPIIFSPRISYSYTFALEKLSLHSLRKRGHHLDALFFCSGLSWPEILHFSLGK
jgi:hypothetical protein